MTNNQTSTNPTRFLIYLLGKNIEHVTFTEMVEEYSAMLPKKKKDNANGDIKGTPTLSP